MLSVDSIEKGIVIDHIKATKSMEIYNLLKLEKLDCSIAIIKNVKSKKMGKKDIIKIENVIDINFDALGYINPNITVNIIEDGKIIDKKNLELPGSIKNIIKCKNPRCITSIEQEIAHEFRLANKEKAIYRCVYCEQKSHKHSI
jgi:aspartate carbamoyltransferase regulatory subunit